MTAVDLRVRPSAELPALLEDAAGFLADVYDEDAALFPYSTLLGPSGHVNDFAHPQTRRYTINSLLGVGEAVRHGVPVGPVLSDVDACVERFLARQAPLVEDPADIGLLLVLLSERDLAPAARATALGRLRAALPERSRLDMQTLAWMLWGAVACARAGDADAGWVADRTFAAMLADFVDTRSAMPRHTLKPARRHVVSFGAIVYYLRALHEYASLTGDGRAEGLFRRAATTVIGAQGELGEWPWMFDARTGVPFDLYPVFTVHQDGMAMLFLFGAIERGLAGARQAVADSVAWGFGRNQLGRRMYREEPFAAYRSIHRAGRALRARRYVRSYMPRPAAPIAADRVRINRETRSYHPGWMLYSWAGRVGEEA